jgi:hypothetical protein
MKELLKRQEVRYLLVLLLGATIGALFYPTKHIEERVSQKYEAEIAVLKETHSKEVTNIQEKLDKTETESKKYKEETETKISKLTTEIKTLQSKQKTAYYKIVRPDGTIEIKKFSESEVNESSQVVTQIQEEFKRKVEQIEDKWKNIHTERVTALKKEFDSKEQEYQKQISELKAEKVVDVNKKNFSVEAGLMTNKNIYGHATMDLWGPIMIGIHAEAAKDGSNSSVGAGVGLRF